MLTQAQMQTLRTDITVTKAATVFRTQTLLQWWQAGDDQTLADFYNEIASPVVKLWRPSVSVRSLNEALVGTDFLGLAQANRDLWFVLTQDVANTTLTLTRQNFVTVFGGASATMTNLTAVAQKDATYLEALFSSAGGAPGNANVSSVFGGRLTGTEVGQSRSA